MAPLTGRAESDVLIKLADAMCAAGQGVDAVAVYQQVAPAAAPEVALRCYQRAAEELIRAGHMEEGLRALREFLPSIGLHLPTHPRLAWISARVRLGLRGLGFKTPPARTLHPAHIARIETCWSAAAHLGMTRHELGAVFQLWHALEALRGGDPDHVAQALALHATYVSFPGRPDLADDPEVMRGGRLGWLFIPRGDRGAIRRRRGPWRDQPRACS